MLDSPLRRRPRGVWVLAAAAAACQDWRPPVAAPSPRLAVFSPAAAETLVALDAASHIVAVGKWVELPAGTHALPRVGTFDRPNAEALFAAGVELVVTTRTEAGQEENRELERLGLQVLALETASLEGVLHSILELGERVGRRPAAEALVASIESRLARVAERGSGRTPRRVLIVVGHEPLWVAGSGSYLDRLLRLCGAENAAGDLPAPFSPASLEAILERKPEVVFEFSSKQASAGSGPDWRRLLEPILGRPPHEVIVPPGLLSVPGPRVADMAEWIEEQLESLERSETRGPP